MNMRALYVVLAIQALFAGALLYVGYTARENRKTAYLELTHRITSGTATANDYEKLQAYLPYDADRAIVRALFGLPLVRRAQLKSDDSKKKDYEVTEVWIYYPLTTDQASKGGRIDVPDAEKLSGEVQIYIVEFDERGRAHAELRTLKHPL